MANAAIAYSNSVDTAALITATTSTLLLPPSNIQVPHVARQWRGNTLGGDSIIIDMGSSISFDTFAAFGLTCAGIRFKASLVDATGTAGEVYDSDTGAVDADYRASIKLTTARSARYFRIECTTDALSYIAIGRVFIGSRVQFAYNFVKGWSRVWNDTSRRSKTRGGQTLVDPDNTFRSIEVAFDFLTSTDRNGFVETIDRVNATKKDVLFITDPDSTNLARDSIFGLITTPTAVVQPYIGTFSKQYMIEERL